MRTIRRLKQINLLATLVAFIMLIFAGVKMIISYSNPNSTESVIGKLLPTGEILSFGIMCLLLSLCNFFASVFLFLNRKIGLIFCSVSMFMNGCVAAFFTHYTNGFFLTLIAAVISFLSAVMSLILFLKSKS